MACRFPKPITTISLASMFTANWWSISPGRPLDRGTTGRAHAIGRRARRRFEATCAIGTVGLLNPKNMDIPWERMSLARFQPAMILADPSMDDSRGLKLAVTVNPQHADKFLAGSGHTYQEILDLADAGKPLPHFAIPTKLKATANVIRTDVLSQNVVACLPGNDPRLKDEYVVFSAHLDHLGIGKPINGDSIYNGAMDNASGVAAELDVAAMLKESGAKLRRSILFVAVTGEEKGLLGLDSSPIRRRSTRKKSLPISIPTCSCRSSRSES